jgi:predicted TIM-barrel fold metal-dependent hydrolase
MSNALRWRGLTQSDRLRLRQTPARKPIVLRPSSSGQQTPMQNSIFGHPAIDCDVHIAVPSTAALMPYLDAYWFDAFRTRGIDKVSFNLTGDPPNTPLAARPDWRPKAGKPGTDLELLRSGALDGFGSSFAIANCLFGGMALHSDDLAAVFCKAVNDWVAEEWLDREPRLRASILVPQQAPELAVAEIERRAGDKRFVQVSLLAMGAELLGRRGYWPIYEAAVRHGLPIGVHAGGLYHHPTLNGWGSFFLEDYVANSFAFENQVVSLVSEGAFAKFPDLKVVLIESGVTWMPPALWRFNKTWRGVRSEVPWVKRTPVEIVRQHIRLTTQPFDEPDGVPRLERFVEQMKSDEMLLFSTDFPHWHFDGTDALPLAPSSPLARKVLCENALATYPRLAESVAKEPASKELSS